MLPSNPEVRRRPVLRSYSMFLTQFVWPLSSCSFCFKNLTSHNATVESSEHVANNLESRNLKTKKNIYILQEVWISLPRFAVLFLLQRKIVCDCLTWQCWHNLYGLYSFLQSGDHWTDQTTGCSGLHTLQLTRICRIHKRGSRFIQTTIKLHILIFFSNNRMLWPSHAAANKDL